LPDANRVDFYLLAEADAGARMRFACRLTEKAYHQNHRVHLHAASAPEAGELDELLWSFRHGSFVPHELTTDGTTSTSPVTIGHGPATPPPADLLINLSDELPDFLDQFPRVAEVVDRSDMSLAAARKRFREYRNRGTEPVTHKIDRTP
jgi:DNA polymerase-3 subunit chi